MKKGVFVGLAGMDFVYYQDSMPLENKKSKTNNYDMQIGGPAANAAITYALLGGNAVLITCIGDSEMGKIIKKELTEVYGVEVIDCSKGIDILPCISSISVNNVNGNRTIWSGQQVFKVNDKINYTDAIKNASFCFSDCNLSVISEQVINEVKLAWKTIILDAGSWKENMNIYLSAARDVIASADCKSPEGVDFITAAQKYGVKNTAVTNGSDFIEWKKEEDGGNIYPPRVEAKDTLGAGDVFHGAYCYFAMEKGLSFQEALEKASEVASLSVQYYGSRQGVKEYINKKR